MPPLVVISLVHSLEVQLAGRRYRVILRDGEAIAVAAWIVEMFGPRTPHAYWRRVWTAERHAPGRVVRVAIAEAKIALAMQDLRPAGDIPAAAAGLSALPAIRGASPRGECRAKEHGVRPVEDEAILHALFSLRDGVSEDQFKVAFGAFVAHLIEAGFARGSRLMRRKPLQGFGAKLPGFTYYAAIEFPDLEREQACYDYVAAGGEPVHAVHRAMNSLVQEGSGHFFVSADI